MTERHTRLKRLAESRRQLTKLLVVAALIEYGLRIDDIDVGEVKKDEIDEAADLARHGSLHVPKVLLNIKKLDRFECYVPAWSRISIETSVLDVLDEFESGEIVISLPQGATKRCVVFPSAIEQEFRELRRFPSQAVGG
ncbi:MAG: hypothetical protein LUQ34_03490 [Euryarchaeota archaeon]|nr:hypothetical protein [Euryarchaeota archaeon]